MDEEPRKRKRTENLLKFGLAIAIGLVAAPVIFVAVQGLVGLALAAAVAVIGVNAAPVVSFKLANRKIKMLKAEAAANPIETMELEYSRRLKLLEERRQNIVDFKTQVSNYEDQLESFKDQWPEDGPKFQAQLDAMKALLKRREAKYVQATEKTQEFEVEIRRADAIWKMTQATKSLRKSAGDLNDEFMAKIKTDTALNSVQTSMNAAFAELDMELTDEETDKTLMPGRQPLQLVETATGRTSINDADLKNRVPR